MKFKMARRLAFFLIIAIIFAPLRLENFTIQKTQAEWWDKLGYTVIRQDTTWHKSESLRFTKGIVVTDGATLTIEQGATVRFSQGGDIFIPILRVINGRIIAAGTQEEKITFMADSAEDQFGISIENNPGIEPSFFRYVVVSDGGYDAGVVFDDHRGVWNTAFAAAGTPALAYNAGKVHIENSKFVKSKTYAVGAFGYIGTENPDDYLEIANSNFENGNKGIAVDADASCDEGIENCEQHIWLKNNWYGDARGPSGAVSSDETDGEAVSGVVFLDNWRKSGLIADPIVIVPGIMGSSQVLGEWSLDPIMHSYDDLISSLKRNGYEGGINLFEFPYDWRNTNKTSALYLQSRIEGILQGTKVSKADVVAHSMGGLVARAYIEEAEGTQYDDTIDQLITLGTPHRGAPEAYLKWEAGEGFFTWKDKLARHHFEQEAEEAGYDDNLKGYIQDKIVSVRELLPDQDYLSDAASGEMREYPDNYPKNSFLEDLNDSAALQKLDPVRFASIIGKSDVTDTISRIRVMDSTVDGRWEHGMPENFYDTDTDQGLHYGEGDETVPLASAQGIVSDRIIEVGSTHGDLPTKAQCEVFRELTGRSECDYYEDIHIANVLLFNVFSPIDIQIVSPSGKRMGKNFETGGIYDEIPGAYYTGYDTKNEFITVPNPEDGEYGILTQGTGEGSYRIEATKITEAGAPGEDAKESTAVFAGTAIIGATGEKKVELLEDDIVISKEDRDIVAPMITIASPESKAYLNDGQVPIAYVIEDDISSAEKIIKEVKLDDAAFNETTVDLSLQTLGDHIFSVKASDEAGNETAQSVTFQNTVTFDSLEKNISRYLSLGLIKREEEAKHIQAYLRYFEKLEELIDRLEQMKHFPSQAKARLMQNFQRELEHKKEALFRYLEKSVQKGAIDSQAKERIMESLEKLVQ